MGRKSKLNLSSLFLKPNAGGDSISSSSSASSSSSSSSSSSWAWPSCKQQPRTDSFRSGPDTTTPTTNNNVVYKTINSVYFDTATDSSSDASLSFEDSDESAIRRLVRSDRLFFEPGTRTSSILEADPAAPALNCDRKSGFSVPATAMEMESEDPYGDFRRSMEEMVAANEKMREWESLEQLLVWYLRANGKRNHGFIVGAFVDLLVALAAAASSDEGGGGGGGETGACRCDSVASTVRFEIEEVEEGSGSC